MRVATKVRVALAARGLTTVELAALLGVSRSAISQRLSADEWSDNGPSGLACVAEVLGVPVDLLRHGSAGEVADEAVFSGRRSER